MPGFFGSRKAAKAAPPPAAEEEEAPPSRDRRFDKEVEIYPVAVKLLWHFYQPADKGKVEGSPKELPGPIEESVADSVKELEKIGVLEVVPGFGDFGITAKLTPLGLRIMSDQAQPGHLAEVQLLNETTQGMTIYREVTLGF